MDIIVMQKANDLTELKDMWDNWNAMPHIDRIRSNQALMARIGLDNESYFNMQYNLLSSASVDAEDDTDYSAEDGEVPALPDPVNPTKSFTDDMYRSAENWANANERVIICNRYDLDELETQMNQFRNQPEHARHICDNISYNIFGINNLSHYSYLKSNLLAASGNNVPIEKIVGSDRDSSSTMSESAIALLAATSAVAIVGKSAYDTYLEKKKNKAVKDPKAPVELPVEYKNINDVYECINFLITETKKLITKMNSDKTIQDQVRERMSELKEDMGDDEWEDSGYSVDQKFVCKLVSKEKDNCAIQIIDADEEICNELDWAVPSLIESLKALHIDLIKKFHISFKEDDEDCGQMVILYPAAKDFKTSAIHEEVCILEKYASGISEDFSWPVYILLLVTGVAIGGFTQIPFLASIPALIYLTCDAQKLRAEYKSMARKYNIKDRSDARQLLLDGFEDAVNKIKNNKTAMEKIHDVDPDAEIVYEVEEYDLRTTRIQVLTTKNSKLKGILKGIRDGVLAKYKPIAYAYHANIKLDGKNGVIILKMSKKENSYLETFEDTDDDDLVITESCVNEIDMDNVAIPQCATLMREYALLQEKAKVRDGKTHLGWTIFWFLLPGIGWYIYRDTVKNRKEEIYKANRLEERYNIYNFDDVLHFILKNIKEDADKSNSARKIKDIIAKKVGHDVHLRGKVTDTTSKSVNINIFDEDEETCKKISSILRGLIKATQYNYGPLLYKYYIKLKPIRNTGSILVTFPEQDYNDRSVSENSHTKESDIKKVATLIKESLEYAYNEMYISELLTEMQFLPTTNVEESYVNTFTNSILAQMNNDREQQPGLLPFFTPDEMEEAGVFKEKAERNFYKVESSGNIEWFNKYKATGNPGEDWFGNVLECWMEYKKNPTLKNKQAVLEYGWNPEVNLTREAAYKVGKVTGAVLKEQYGIEIVDCTTV